MCWSPKSFQHSARPTPGQISTTCHSQGTATVPSRRTTPFVSLPEASSRCSTAQPPSPKGSIPSYSAGRRTFPAESISPALPSSANTRTPPWSA